MYGRNNKQIKERKEIKSRLKKENQEIIMYFLFYFFLAHEPNMVNTKHVCCE